MILMAGPGDLVLRTRNYLKNGLTYTSSAPNLTVFINYVQ